MANTIKWQRGTFHKFFAKMKIRIGGKDNTVDRIEKGDEFEYDGSILKYLGAEVASTQLRGAIEGGWASLDPDDNSSVSSFVSNRDMAKSTTVNRDLSRVQRGGSISGTDNLDEETVLTVSDRGKTELSSSSKKPKILTQENNRRIQVSEYDSQEGVTVGRVRSAAKITADVSSNSNISLAKDIENRGLGRPILNKKIVKEGISIEVNSSPMSKDVYLDEDDGRVVGKVRHTKKTSTEGIEIADTSNIRAASIVEEASKPRKKTESIIDTKVSPRIRMARRIDPNFPSDWSFEGKLKDRIDAIKKHGETPTFLEAVYAAEGDQMRRLMEKTYPKQFSDR